MERTRAQKELDHMTAQNRELEKTNAQMKLSNQVHVRSYPDSLS